MHNYTSKEGLNLKNRNVLNKASVPWPSQRAALFSHYTPPVPECSSFTRSQRALYSGEHFQKLRNVAFGGPLRVIRE